MTIDVYNKNWTACACFIGLRYSLSFSIITLSFTLYVNKEFDPRGVDRPLLQRLPRRTSCAVSETPLAHLTKTQRSSTRHDIARSSPSPSPLNNSRTDRVQYLYNNNTVRSCHCLGPVCDRVDTIRSVALSSLVLKRKRRSHRCPVKALPCRERFV
jgi:hypothetical protein